MDSLNDTTVTSDTATFIGFEEAFYTLEEPISDAWLRSRAASHILGHILDSKKADDGYYLLVPTKMLDVLALLVFDVEESVKRLEAGYVEHFNFSIEKPQSGQAGGAA